MFLLNKHHFYLTHSMFNRSSQTPPVITFSLVVIPSSPRSVRSGTCTRRPIGVFTSDFAKAFKQIPGVESMIDTAIVIQWDPTRNRPAYFMPFAQVFGGPSTPLVLCVTHHGAVMPSPCLRLSPVSTAWTTL